MTLFPQLEQYVQDLKFAKIPQERKKQLSPLIAFLKEKLESKEPVHLNFICTHNSRRSQLCQIWAETFSRYFGIEQVKVFSGGTEATAFHPNAVTALRKAGFQITKENEQENPKFNVIFSEDAEPVICFSKKFEEAVSSVNSFVAILTCSDAEANCPFIPEAEARFSIKYEDPKKADGTPAEQDLYSKRNKQIASEMYYLLSQTTDSQN